MNTSKQKQLWFKLAMICALILALQIPLLWVKGSMHERMRSQQEAAHDISQSWSNAQNLTGPIIVVPYKVKSYEEVWDKNLDAYVTKERLSQKRAFIVPKSTQINGHATVEHRKRGIYSAPVYRTEITVKGEFDLQEYNQIKSSDKVGDIGKPFLVTLIGDLRGVSEIPELQYADKTAVFTEGNRINVSTPGLNAPIDIDGLNAFEFSYHLNLKGSKTLGFFPLAKDNKVQVSSEWPHPKFHGRFLPDRREVSENGFNVTWNLNSLSSNVNSVIDACEIGDCNTLLTPSFGVDFIEPISAYSLSDRAGKYALLFLLLTFAAFFMFEILKRLLIHPLQYLMVGLSLSVFYLLLTALSEHLAFATAYWISALGCISLIGIYTSAVLAGKVRALTLSSALLLIYGCIFVILNSEDFAFLMGALLIFSSLGALMLMTRNVNWYQLGEQLAVKKELDLQAS